MVCKKEPLKGKWDRELRRRGQDRSVVLYHNADVTDNKFVSLDVTG